MEQAKKDLSSNEIKSQVQIDDNKSQLSKKFLEDMENLKQSFNHQIQVL